MTKHSPYSTVFKTMVIGIVLTLVVSPQSYAQFTPGYVVSVTDGDDSYGNKSPRIAITDQGEVVVFWMRTGNEAFYLSRWDGQGFSSPSQIPFGGLNPNLWSGSLGPNFATGNGHMYVTFEVYGDAIYITHSGDNGLTWDDPVAAFVPPQGRRATIPTVAVDADGQPLVAYVNTNAQEGDAHYGLVRSSDFGASFSAEAWVNEIAAGEEVCECCNGDIAVSPNGDIYVAFRNNDANLRDIWVARSTDGGLSFSEAYDMDETDWVSGVCPSNGPHLLAEDGAVHAAFFSASSSWGSGVYFSSLDPLLGNVSSTLTLPPAQEESSQQNRPRIAGSGDTLGVVWQESYNGSLEIGMSFSTTGISGLGSDQGLLTELSGSQRYPDMLFHDGKFHVVYEDVSSGTVLYQAVHPGLVGMEEEQLSFSIFPNPVRDELNYQMMTQGPIELQIFDALSRSCGAYSGLTGSGTLNLNTLTPGFYHLRVHTENGETSVIRFIKE
ncbi:MAG: T9SS type A sorting domain-containing protein [Flavobacteriales bacterium]|nr:T9SS type A sorting domain-containing protein [Flavobacteriales bacterium]